MKYMIFAVVILFLSVLAPFGAAAEVFRYDCRLTGLGAGKLELDFNDKADVPVKVRLTDGGRTVASVELSTSEYSLNMVKGDVTCKGDRIEIMSQQPFSAAEETVYLRRNKGRLVVEKVVQENPSEDTVEKARRLLKSGEVGQAVNLLNGDIQYRYESVPLPVVEEALKRAHESALRSFRAGDVKGAADLLGEALELYDDIGGFHSVNTGKNHRYVAAENDYGFFLYTCKRFEEAREVLGKVVQMAPGRSVAHLNYGDCLWELGDRNGALREYSLYAKAIPKGKWPPQILQRCPVCK